MTFAWPLALASLIALPLLAAVWLIVRRRKRAGAVRLSHVGAARAAAGPRTRARRWVPSALLGLGLLAAGLAVARPQTTVDVPSSDATIMLAIDVSGSMCSTDVDPNRLIAAQEAAIEFINSLGEDTQIGIVAFASSAAVVQEPTDDREELEEAINALTTSRGTAIGQAILTSIDAIAAIDSDVAPTGVEVTEDDTADAEEGYAAEVIVVLTDGSNSEGVDPVTAAEEAQARGLRVYTIGFGTTEQASSVCDPTQTDTSEQLGGMGGAGGGGGAGQQIDEATLTEVAEMTGAEYFSASAADELTDVLLDLPGVIEVQQEKVDIAYWFAAASALLVTGAVGLSLWWSRVPRRSSRPGSLHRASP